MSLFWTNNQHHNISCSIVLNHNQQKKQQQKKAQWIKITTFTLQRWSGVNNTIIASIITNNPKSISQWEKSYFLQQFFAFTVKFFLANWTSETINSIIQAKPSHDIKICTRSLILFTQWLKVTFLFANWASKQSKQVKSITQSSQI